MTTVSQKVPVAETSACRTGFRVCAAAATIGARAETGLVGEQPARYAVSCRLGTLAPVKPPAAAVGLKALATISSMRARAGQVHARRIRRIRRHRRSP